MTIKSYLPIVLLTFSVIVYAQTKVSNKPPTPQDNFTTRATCRIDTAIGVYVYFEDGQHGLYKHMTARQLGLAYAPRCGFALPTNALNSVVIPTKAAVTIDERTQ